MAAQAGDARSLAADRSGSNKHLRDDRDCAANLDHDLKPSRTRCVAAFDRSEGSGRDQLTEEFDISLAAVSKHAKGTGEGGLVSREILGRDYLIRTHEENLRAASVSTPG